jgi:hypothetical protein
MVNAKQMRVTMSRNIDYGNLMHTAMRGLIKKVFTDVAANGLPGAHHFFITFDTHHPDAELADWLSDRYPGEMTVVMQHWYDKLDVGEDGFGVCLNFGEAPEPLYIPYAAIKTFVDPSVEFGLRFESQDDEDTVDTPTNKATPDILPTAPMGGSTPENNEKKTDGAAADIVSLDSFRK